MVHAGSPPPLIALFNYGGGMRGLIPAYIMNHIEQVTGLRMAEMVDVFCGPSTGAILNAALTLRHPDRPNEPKYKARHMIRFYEREGARIFPPDRFRSLRGLIHDFNNRTMRISQLNNIFKHGHYDPGHLNRALRSLYGNARLGETLQSLIIPFYNIQGAHLQAVAENDESAAAPVHTQNNVITEGGHAVWLKHMKINGGFGIKRGTADVLLHDAVTASAAAPTFFPCHNFEAQWGDKENQTEYAAIDGSIFDNPCITYLGALRQHLLPGQKLIIIAFGTGYTNRTIKKEDWNRYGSLGVVDPVNDLPLINIFFHASETALWDTFADEMGDNLYVFNKSLISDREEDWPSTQIDDASPENLDRLKKFAETIIEEQHAKLAAVCDILVSNYERKKRDESKKPEARSWKDMISQLIPMGE